MTILFLSCLGNPALGITKLTHQTITPLISEEQGTDHSNNAILAKASFYGFHLNLESADSINGSNHPSTTDLASMNAHFWGIPEFEIHN
jgi:hypothetical protein